MTVLVLLHHAGGSAALYRPLLRELPPHLEPLVLELPGRGRRWREPTLRSAAAAVDDLTGQLLRKAGNAADVAIFGHSMGAYLGLCVAARLERRVHGPRCRVLFASANLAPRLASPLFDENAEVSDEDVLRCAGTFGAMDTAALSDPHIAARAVSLLRADFDICDSFVRTLASTVTESRIVVCRGDEDKFGAEHTDPWQLSATEPIETRTFPGGHLYPETAAAPLAAKIAEITALSSALPGT